MPLLLQLGAAEEVAAADDDGHLDALADGLGDLLGDAAHDGGVEPEPPPPNTSPESFSSTRWNRGRAPSAVLASVTGRPPGESCASDVTSSVASSDPSTPAGRLDTPGTLTAEGRPLLLRPLRRAVSIREGS